MRILFAFILLCATAASVSGVFAERRVALVVGNSDYAHSTKLANPINDATDVAAALEDVGFQVITATDVDVASFRAAIAAFAREAKGADVSLFYYSGHGMQWEGQNVLVPTDATLDDAEFVPFEVLPIAEITTALSRARNAKILILDACRDNDAERSLKIALAEKQGNKSTAVERGLTKLEATTGQVVVFATQAGRTATDDFDGSSRNSPFTHAFLESIREPGLEIGRTFRKVAARVHELTRGAQLPETSISLLGDFYFIPDKAEILGEDSTRSNVNIASLPDPEETNLAGSERITNRASVEVTYRIENEETKIHYLKQNSANGEIVEQQTFSAHESLASNVISAIQSADTNLTLDIEPGLTSHRVADALSTIHALTDQVAHLPDDGALAPGRYSFKRGASRNEVIQAMTDRQESKLANFLPLMSKNLPVSTMSEVVIIASIVETVTDDRELQRLVASALLNRLELGMRLQVDSTVIYGLTMGQGELERELTMEDLQSDTPYNTYSIEGLPPTAISNPGTTSLKAVLQPQQTDYIYFIIDGDGFAKFASTLSGHSQNIKEYREYRTANSD